MKVETCQSGQRKPRDPEYPLTWEDVAGEEGIYAVDNSGYRFITIENSRQGRVTLVLMGVAVSFPSEGHLWGDRNFRRLESAKLCMEIRE